jgi:phosphonate transport system permease protein
MSVSTDVVAHVIAVEKKQATKSTAVTVLIGLFILLSLWQSGLLNGQRLSQGLPAIGVMVSEMIPPDFARWRQWVSPMIDTLTMSVAGTFLAVLFSLPLAFLAARTSAPNKFVYQASRMLLNALRSIPELILGIIFVAAVGFGMLPGVLALGLHSIGMVGKFFAEAVEHSHNGPIEAVQAVGGSRIQVITHGILPQVFPKFLDVTMYRWEYNFRASTVMGMVGAGGIGTELVGSLRLIDYPQVAAILLLILAAVTAVDALSNYARSKLS